MRRVAALGLPLFALAAPAQAAVACATTRAGVVAAVDARLDLTLADGMRLRLIGIEAAGPTPDDPILDETARDTLSTWLVGRNIAFLPAPDAADRWGRVPALVEAAPPEASAGAPLSVGAALLDAGLARFRPEAAPAGCLAGWAGLEAKARETGLGLWRDSFYAILKTGKREALAEHAGTNVIVEGQLAAIRQQPQRTTLVLQAEGGRLNLTIVARKSKAFAAAGLTAPALVGRRLRARGMLDLQFGAHIDLDSPDEVEVLAADAPAQAATIKPAD